MTGAGYVLAEVRRTERLTPRMQRVVLAGDGLATWRGSGHADEWLGLRFGPEAGRAVRVLTVRRFDGARGELTVDVVLHDRGVASAWARAAKPGDQVGLGAASGRYAPPVGTTHQVLVADAPGLPALARIMEELPEDATAQAFVQVAGPEDAQELATRGHVDVTWLHGCGLGHEPTRLPDVVRTLDLTVGTPYVWVAGEADVTRRIRSYLRHELGLPTGTYSVAGYWRLGQEEWQARYDQAGIDLRAIYDAGVRAGKDPEEIRDEYDALLARRGL